MNRMFCMLRWCRDQVRHLEEFHAKKIASNWPAPFKLSKSGLLVFVALSMTAIGIAAHVRTSQYDVWHNAPGFAAPDSAYLFSTTDAPYFLRLAGALKRGETNAEFESLLAYPDNKRLAEESPEQFNKTSPPLLSQVIAYLSPTDHPADLLRIGNQMVHICAAITALLIISPFPPLDMVCRGLWPLQAPAFRRPILCAVLPDVLMQTCSTLGCFTSHLVLSSWRGVRRNHVRPCCGALVPHSRQAVPGLV